MLKDKTKNNYSLTQAQAKVEMSILVEVYGSLLTERQRYIVSTSCDYDVSLSEISETLGVTRQAVYESKARAEGMLKEYEEKLGLIKQMREINRIARLKEGGEEQALQKIAELTTI